MRKTLLSLLVAVLATLPVLVALPFLLDAQQIGSGTFYLATVPGSGSQSALRVTTSTTPNRIDLGCETDRIGSATVNGARYVGAATLNSPSLRAVACTGGDTNIGFILTGAGTGTLGLNSDTTGAVTVGNATGGATLPGATTITGALTLSGGIATTVSHRNFFSATEHCKSDIPSASLVTVRVGANDWAISRTAGGAETYNIKCSFSLPFRTTASKGARIDSFSISQQITVAALTSNTFTNLATTTYANNVANAVAAYGGVVTITMPTATQANPYLTAATLGTPAFNVTANTNVNVEWVVVMQNTGVYKVYGIELVWTQAEY